MTRFTIIFLLMTTCILGPDKFNVFPLNMCYQLISYTITPMEALDIVKETYAANFTKNSLQENPEDYYYKLDTADFYLVYEDTDDITGNYLIHLYEFVIDDTDTGIGHTVTYGWYWVDQYSSEISVFP